MEHILNYAFIFFLVIDPFGTLPIFRSILEKKTFKQRRLFTVLELLIALAVMLSFIFIGKIVTKILDISHVTTEISGGVVLFLIAIKMIFSHEEKKSFWSQNTGYIVPVAVPLLAGPSLLATVTVYTKLNIDLIVISFSLLLAWIPTFLLYFFSGPIYRVIKDKGLLAIQRLMGLLIALVASELFIQGVKDLIKGQ